VGDVRVAGNGNGVGDEDDKGAFDAATTVAEAGLEEIEVECLPLAGIGCGCKSILNLFAVLGFPRQTLVLPLWLQEDRLRPPPVVPKARCRSRRRLIFS
jgi:hypothetical protein